LRDSVTKALLAFANKVWTSVFANERSDVAVIAFAGWKLVSGRGRSALDNQKNGENILSVGAASLSKGGFSGWLTFTGTTAKNPLC